VSFYLRDPVEVTGVSLKLFRVTDMSPYTMYVYLRWVFDDITNVINSNLATASRGGADLNNITTDINGAWFDFSFDTPYVCHTLKQWAICVGHTGPNYNNRINWKSNYATSGYSRLFGGSAMAGISSGDYGASWGYLDSSYYRTPHFKLYGKNPLGLMKQGDRIYPVTTSGADAQFIIEDYFTNYCGSTVTVREVGLYGSLNEKSTTERRQLATCLARDVLAAPIDVLNGEILRVRYIPQITV
jgi:hypothetical protein